MKDCTDNANLGGKIRPIDGTDQWAAISGSVAEVVPREWLPITPDSIIYQERWCGSSATLSRAACSDRCLVRRRKLIINADSTYWYIPSCGSSPPLPSCCDAACRDKLSDQGAATKAAWPCHDPAERTDLDLSDRGRADERAELALATGRNNTGGCSVCTPLHPCLFDLLADQEERTNVASKEPALVAKLKAQLATYVPYICPGGGQGANPDNASTVCHMDAAVLREGYDCVTDIRPWWGDFSGPCCKPK